MDWMSIWYLYIVHFVITDLQPAGTVAAANKTIFGALCRINSQIVLHWDDEM